MPADPGGEAALAPRTLAVRVAERSLRMASVRYRGLLPAAALCDLGHRVQVCSGTGCDTRAAEWALAVKPLTVKDTNVVRGMIDGGMSVVLDLCDNIFIDDYAGQGQAIPDRFSALAQAAAGVTVPTAGMVARVVAHCGLPAGKVRVVPDIVEDAAALARQAKLLDASRGPLHDTAAAMRELVRRLPQRLANARPGRPRRLLWFGNHGASYANFGISDLLLFREAIERVAKARPVELWVVSNSKLKYEALARAIDVPMRYFEWCGATVDRLLAAADVTLVPNSLDEFSRTKSANRALKSLAAGVPVVATPSEAYAGLESALWLGDPAEGLAACLGDPALVARQIAAGQCVIAADYSPDALRRAMLAVLGATVRA